MPYSDQIQLQELADQLLKIRKNPDYPPLDCKKWAGFQPSTICQAYQVQNLVARCLEPIAAWKAYKLPDGQSIVGAPIFQTDCYQSDALDAHRSFRSIAVEAELGYRLAEDLDPEYGAYTAEDMMDLVDAVLPLIEVVDSRLEDFQSVGPFWQLADNSVNGGIALADEISDWHNIDPVRQKVDLYCDNQLLVRGNGWQASHSPLQLIAGFANQLSDHCGGIKKGQVIATGSLTGFNIVSPGAVIEARFRNCDRNIQVQF